MAVRSWLRGWLSLAVVAVVVQEALTAYPKGQSGQHVLVVAAIGAGLFLVALASSGAGGVNAARVGPLALAYLVQAGVMVVPTVRQWTRQARQAEPTPVAG